MTATPNRPRPRVATVKLTPSTQTEPFGTTKRESPRGIEKETVQELPDGTIDRTREIPSTCPMTKWPESASPQRSARSTFASDTYFVAARMSASLLDLATTSMIFAAGAM